MEIFNIRFPIMAKVLANLSFLFHCLYFNPEVSWLIDLYSLGKVQFGVEGSTYT